MILSTKVKESIDKNSEKIHFRLGTKAEWSNLTWTKNIFDEKILKVCSCVKFTLASYGIVEIGI